MFDHFVDARRLEPKPKQIFAKDSEVSLPMYVLQQTLCTFQMDNPYARVAVFKLWQKEFIHFFHIELRT